MTKLGHVSTYSPVKNITGFYTTGDYQYLVTKEGTVLYLSSNGEFTISPRLPRSAVKVKTISFTQ